MIRVCDLVFRWPIPFLAILSLQTSAHAMAGNTTVVRNTGPGRHIVMIISTRGNVCSGTALGRDLVLTAAHCVAPPTTYRVLVEGPPGVGVERIAIHPRYSPKDYSSGRVTADVARVKLDAPLPTSVVPAPIAGDRKVQPGDHFVVAGYGATRSGSEAGMGTPRAAWLVATGKPGNLQIRLHDPATRGLRAGLGA